MNAPSASAPSDLVSGPCNRIVIYCRDVEAMVSFYSTYFGFQVVARPDDRITELRRADGGLILMLHPASKGQKEGQDGEEECSLSGDVNTDGSVNIQDVIIVVNVVLGSTTDVECADYNGDEVVNIQDIILVVNDILS